VFSVEPTQSLALTFDENVRLAPTNSVPSITNLTTQQQISWATVAVAYDTIAKRVLFSFPGYPHGLPDGNYRALFSSIHLIDAAGNPLTSDVSVDFFVLAGDANRDRTVGPGDLNVLASRFGQAGTFRTGDFDYDGLVGPTDFNLLASRFGTTLTPPPAAGIVQLQSSEPDANRDATTLSTLHQHLAARRHAASIIRA
jgi:hypothetical protein